MIVLDIFMIGLLLLTILYCARLSMSIKRIEESSGDIADMVEKVSVATDLAKKDLSYMERSANDVIRNLKLKIGDAERLGDDLSFVLQRSQKVMDNLEKIIKLDGVMKKQLLDMCSKKKEGVAFNNYLNAPDVRNDSKDVLQNHLYNKEDKKLRLHDIMSKLYSSKV